MRDDTNVVVLKSPRDLITPEMKITKFTPMGASSTRANTAVSKENRKSTSPLKRSSKANETPYASEFKPHFSGTQVDETQLSPSEVKEKEQAMKR